MDIYDAVMESLAKMAPVSSEQLGQLLLDQAAAAFQARGFEPTARMVRFVAALRSGIGLEEDWLQEYCGAFISTAENFIPPELLVQCISPEASESAPPFMWDASGGAFAQMGATVSMTVNSGSTLSTESLGTTQVCAVNGTVVLVGKKTACSLRACCRFASRLSSTSSSCSRKPPRLTR